MTKMESFNGKLLINLTPPDNDSPSLSQHSFYTYAQQKVYAKENARVIAHIQRVWEVRKKMTEEEFIKKFDVPQTSFQKEVYQKIERPSEWERIKKGLEP